VGKGKKKKGQLTGLAAALVKSGHLDEEKARKLAHEQRKQEKAQLKEQKQLGKAKAAEREARAEAEAEARREAEAAAQRAKQRDQDAEATMERVRETIREAIFPGADGSRRWFFVTRDGRVPFLNVSQGAARLLDSGEAGIVESLGEADADHVVVESQRALMTLHNTDPELVRFWNRR